YVTGSGNRVEGNYLGTDAAGTAGVPNASGVWIEGAGNTVGGTTAGARNVISGNVRLGVVIDGPGASGNVVQGNYSGTDAAGTQRHLGQLAGRRPDQRQPRRGKLGAGQLHRHQPRGHPGRTQRLCWIRRRFGINIADASHNHVDGNVISGNGDPASPYDAGPAGITMAQYTGTSQDNTVTNNKIGVGPDGTTPIPNLQGVVIGGGAQYNSFEGNVVAHNIWQGVQLFDDFLPEPTPTSDNVIRTNEITNNGAN